MSKERQFRELYKKVAGLDEKDVDFMMNVKEYDKEKNTWFSAMFSRTLIPFYSALIAVTLIVMFAIF